MEMFGSLRRISTASELSCAHVMSKAVSPC
jgi:hypothetical protein